nr:hypothetical protein [Tanacetum cinerariifolium]
MKTLSVTNVVTKDEEEVSEDEDVTRVKVLMALADDELIVGKSQARNGERVDITIRKVNTLLSMDKDADWQNYFKYINIDLKFVKEQRLNFLSKYNKIVFKLNKCRDELLSLKQAKLDVVTFHIQNTELTKLNHALQEQLNEEKKINEKWLTSSKKVSQCISEQISHQKKKVLEGELLTESLSKININENAFISASMRILYYMICKREDHRTSDHEMYIASLNKSENYKAQPYQYASISNQILKAKASYTHCGFNNHRPDDYINYLKCEICGSYDHLTSGHNRVIHIRGGVLAESSIRVKCNTCESTVHSTSDHNEFDHFKRVDAQGYDWCQELSTQICKATRERIPDISYFHVFGCHAFIHNHKDHLGKFDAKANDGYFLGYFSVLKAFRVYNTRRQQIEETYHIPDEFLHKDDLSRQYQVDYDISCYVNPHRRSLTELTQENHVPEVIVPNEHDVPLTEDIEDPPELIYMEWTHEQNIQDDQMITQPTNVPSGNNTKFSRPITEPLVPDVSKALKHPGWIDAMQEELNQNKKDEHGTTTKNKARLVAQGYSQEERIDYTKTFAPVARMEAIRIFLAFTTYMNFKVYQMDAKSAFLNGKLKEEIYVKQPPGFESSEFPDYVCKLDKALYGFKKAPKTWYETLSTFLIQNKFSMGRINNTLFIYKSKGDVLLVQVHVDDIIFGSTSYKLCKQFEKLMTNKFEMRMMGKLTYFFGLQIKQDDKGILICQKQYTRNLLKKYDISNSSLVKTPMALISKDIQTQTMMAVTWTEKALQVLVKYLVENWFVGVPKNSSLWLCPQLKLNMLLLLGVVQGLEASGALSKKRKRPKSNIPPTETKVTPPRPTEGSEKSQSVSLGTIHDPQDIERDIQLVNTGLPSTLDVGTRKSKPLSKGTATHPKDSGGSKQPLDRDITSTTPDEGMAKTTPRHEGSHRDKDSGGTKHPLIWNNKTPLMLISQELVLTTKRTRPNEAQESKEDILGAGEEMNDNPQSDETQHQSSPPREDKPTSSTAPHTKASNTDSSSDKILKKYDNIVPLIERQIIPLIERQIVKYLRKVSHVLFERITEDQWEKHEEAVVHYVNLKAFIDDY